MLSKNWFMPALIIALTPNTPPKTMMATMRIQNMGLRIDGVRDVLSSHGDVPGKGGRAKPRAPNRSWLRRTSSASIAASSRGSNSGRHLSR